VARAWFLVVAVVVCLRLCTRYRIVARVVNKNHQTLNNPSRALGADAKVPTGVTLPSLIPAPSNTPRA
jgi:hypothetical protein